MDDDKLKLLKEALERGYLDENIYDTELKVTFDAINNMPSFKVKYVDFSTNSVISIAEVKWLDFYKNHKNNEFPIVNGKQFRLRDISYERDNVAILTISEKSSLEEALPGMFQELTEQDLADMLEAKRESERIEKESEVAFQEFLASGKAYKTLEVKEYGITYHKYFNTDPKKD